MRNFRLALGLALITVMALGASAFASDTVQPDIPGDLGPDDPKVLIYNNSSTTSDAAIMWTAEPPSMGTVTYTVYRAYVGNLMNNMPLDYAFLFQATSLQCEVDTSGNLVNSPNCAKDPLYGYIRVVDSGLTNYEEYNYLVKSSADDVADPNQALNDYVVVRAFPPTQTRHGNYTEYTNACTACHGLHSSKTQRLLKGPTITDLCGTCHDGTGSKYDEVRGRVRTGPSWNNSAFAAAGPFGDALKAGSGVVTTSVHNVARACDPNNEWSYDDTLNDKTGCADGSNAPADKIWMAPGSGFLLEAYLNGDNSAKPTNNSGDRTYRIVTNDWGSWLSCSSCHEPHDRGKNFRLFRPVINDRTNIVVRGVTMVDKDFNETTTDRGVLGRRPRRQPGLRPRHVHPLARRRQLGHDLLLRQGGGSVRCQRRGHEDVLPDAPSL